MVKRIAQKKFWFVDLKPAEISEGGQFWGSPASARMSINIKKYFL